MKKYFGKINFATLIFALGGLIAAGYLTTYLFTVTDNAFVVENLTPISASVSGKISAIYVENGQRLKKGDPILLIHPEKYNLEYQGVKAQYEQAKVGLEVIQKQIQVTTLNLQAAQKQLERMQYEYTQKNDKSVSGGVPQIELKTLEYNIQSQQNIVASLKQQIILEQTQLKQAEVGIDSLKATTQKSAMDVADTIVYAPTDGYVQNMFIGVGTAALAHEGLFSFVNTHDTYIQANFNETDLAHVKAGDKVWVFPRTYLGTKVFHGVVMSDNWSVDRQHILPMKETQLVFGANHWLNLPQRLPVQIKITDPDPKFQLRPGMSAYIYISTR